MTKLRYIVILILLLQLNTAFSQKKTKKVKGSTSTSLEVSSDDRLKAERLFFDGEKEKLLGNLEEAYSYFNQATNTNPQLDAAFYEIAQIQQLAKDYASAQKSIEKALVISPKNEWYLQYYGDIYAAQFKYEDAAKIYHKLVEQSPKSYDYYYQESYYLILSNQLKEALAVYEELESHIGVQADISLQKHKIYNRLNKTDEAEAEFLKLIKAFPDEAEFKSDLADFYLSNGKVEKALALYEEILKTDENNILALTALADVYKRQGDEEKSLEYSKKAFANSEIPIDAKISVLYNYIKFYDQKKESIGDAFQLSDILIEAHPNEAKAYAIAGDLRNLDDKPKEALTYYYQSLEKQKDIFTVWQQVFFINSDLKNYDQLLESTNEAKEYFPNQSLVYFFNGLANQQLKNLNEAETAYLRGVKMAGENNALKGQFYSNLGDLYNDLNKFALSDEYFEKALELDGKNAYVLNNYSYYLSLRGENLEHAAEMSLKSNQLVPNSSSFLDTYAWILYKSAKYSEAKEWQEKAIRASDEVSGTLLEHLGDILFKLGEVDKALEEWKKAMNVGGGSELLPKKLSDKKLYE